MQCRFCGRTNPDQAEVCQGCGSSLLETPTPPAETQPATTSPATPASPAGSAPAAPATPAAYPSSATAVPPRYAGFWRRVAAYLLDYVLLGAVLTVISVLWFYPRIAAALPLDENATLEETMPLFRLVLQLAAIELVVYWLYYSLMESSRLQATIGKIAMGIQVTDAGGKRISFGRASFRFFGKILSTAIFFIGFIMAGLTSRKQALHDILADTLVVIKAK